MSTVRRVIVIRTTLGRHSSRGESWALMSGVRSSECRNHVHDANNTPRIHTRTHDAVMATTQLPGGRTTRDARQLVAPDLPWLLRLAGVARSGLAYLMDAGAPWLT